MKKIEVRISGLGGQGVVLSSEILGRAAALYDKINAVQTQAYGSDIRGGNVYSEVIVSYENILYPVVNNPDILIALAQEAFNINISDLKHNGILIIDSDLVNPSSVPKGVALYKASFNKIAIEELKSKTIANMIMLGYMVEKTDIVTHTALRKSIADLVPPKTLELNLKGLNRGIALAKENV